MKHLIFLALGFLVFSGSAQTNDGKEGRLIFSEDFSKPLDTTLWKVELQPSPGSAVTAGNGKLSLQTGAGVTVWLNRLLKGNIRITYDRTVIVNGGKFDRLSDFNQFWMARDPKNPNLFTRSGKLEDYNNLELYYVGMGGNTNSTTRFRRYDGADNRELIGELLDKPHLLLPNHLYHIELRVESGVVSYWVDGQRFFSYTDKNPLTSGYFGFRSTKSNHEISNLRVYQLD
jgi:rhamnogalacturonan endolyase